MKKITLLILCFSMTITISVAQEIMRSTLGISGSSSLVSSGSKHYFVQQSVGQTSVIGKFQSNGMILRQGFIQPPMLSSKVIPEETNLEAIIYPNPVNNEVNITFKEAVKEIVYIQIFDLLGRSVYTKEMNPAQQLNINLSFLASAQYLFLINTGEKQFKANLIKR
ncbi:T9SS type A sorting domain-containing protein [Lutibacter sp.]|uniref:T9SS type A sorting domain-containing protein n=1 Tax=Lutibacter sp. TaxID=1925666 RepID=UPI0035650AB1